MTARVIPSEESTDQMSRKQARAVLLTGVLLGIGVIGFIDETLFHQLLQWHTFYWATDQHGRILSDGLFHLFSTLVLLWGIWRIWHGRADWSEASAPLLLAGMLMGMGGFNLYDGLIQHALLHWHLVNEHVCNLAITHGDNTLANCPQDIPYELVWDSAGFLILLVGWIYWRSQRRTWLLAQRPGFVSQQETL